MCARLTFVVQQGYEKLDREVFSASKHVSKKSHEHASLSKGRSNPGGIEHVA